MSVQSNPFLSTPHPDLGPDLINPSGSTPSFHNQSPEAPSTHEGMASIIRTSLYDQLARLDKAASRMNNEKSPQELLIEYLHKKMDQDGDMNRILIASMERMTKIQADAQVQAASLLKDAAQNLRTFSAGTEDQDVSESSEDGSSVNGQH